MFFDDRQIAAATCQLPCTLFYTFEAIDIGRDGLWHVSESYADRGDFEFTKGAPIRKVELEFKVPASLAGGTNGSR